MKTFGTVSEAVVGQVQNRVITKIEIQRMKIDEKKALKIQAQTPKKELEHPLPPAHGGCTSEEGGSGSTPELPNPQQGDPKPGTSNTPAEQSQNPQKEGINDSNSEASLPKQTVNPSKKDPSSTSSAPEEQPPKPPPKDGSKNPPKPEQHPQKQSPETIDPKDPNHEQAKSPTKDDSKDPGQKSYETHSPGLRSTHNDALKKLHE